MRKVSWFYEKVHDFTLCHYTMNQNFIQNAFRNFPKFFTYCALQCSHYARRLLANISCHNLVLISEYSTRVFNL